jgi:hypothetical protein
MNTDKHWSVRPTPIPEVDNHEVPDSVWIQQEFARRADAMETEMEDQCEQMGYDDKVKGAIMEGCVIGTGVVKGIVPGVKRVERWGMYPSIDPMTGLISQTWDMRTDEVAYPSMGDNNISIFDCYPDPYAMRMEDASGHYQRHVLNRGQLEDLIEDESFDKAKIRDILTEHSNGNHAALYHEVERRRIANITDTSGAMSGRFDVLEYWGQVSGQLLSTLQVEGMEDVEDHKTYFCCVWVCASRTILARIAPMKRSTIPYHYFPYSKVPHQFWGISPVRMMRASSLPMQNAALRALCDDLAINTLPMSEVNTQMLKEGQDPRGLKPGHRFLRDKGDPSEPAIRWYTPGSKANTILPILDVSRRAMDEETNLPSYTQGMQIKGANNTASGTSMLMGAANVTLKSVIKNLEDGLIKPLLRSLYDWNMQWNPRQDIKGDMSVDVKGLTALTSKEVQSQRLVQFAQIAASIPPIAQRTDFVYLGRALATSVEIDPDKAIPELNEQTPMELAQLGQGNPYQLNAPDGQAGMGPYQPVPSNPAQGIVTGNGDEQLNGAFAPVAGPTG